MHVVERRVGHAAVVVVARRLVVVARVDVDQPRRIRARRVDAQPRDAVVDAVVVLQRVGADRDLVGRADAAAVRRRDALLVDLVAEVLGLREHRVDAKRRGLAELDVEVARAADVAAGAGRRRHLADVGQKRHLVDLVDDAAGRAAPEQHRGRAAQELDAVEAEHVALVEGRIAHAVDEDVAARGEREAAQADVLLAAFGRLEGDARRLVERFLDGVDAPVLDQLFGDDGDRLRNVAQLLHALADRARGGAHRVLVGLCLGLDRDRLEHRLVLAGAPDAGGAGGATWAIDWKLIRPKPAASAPSGRSRGTPVEHRWRARGRSARASDGQWSSATRHVL